jgi:hypothetical protein
MNYAALIDLISLILMMLLVVKVTKKCQGIADYVACLMVGGILLCATKWLVIGIGWGFTYPVNPLPKAHIIADIISLAFWAFMLIVRPIPYFRKRLTFK